MEHTFNLHHHYKSESRGYHGSDFNDSFRIITTIDGYENYQNVMRPTIEVSTCCLQAFRNIYRMHGHQYFSSNDAELDAFRYRSLPKPDDA